MPAIYLLYLNKIKYMTALRIQSIKHLSQYKRLKNKVLYKI